MPIRVTISVCPYCAVGCSQQVYVRDGRITSIEGNPDSPINRGRLFPKGSATFQLVTGTHRLDTVRCTDDQAPQSGGGSRSTTPWTG